MLPTAPLTGSPVSPPRLPTLRARRRPSRGPGVSYPVSRQPRCPQSPRRALPWPPGSCRQRSAPAQGIPRRHLPALFSFFLTKVTCPSGSALNKNGDPVSSLPTVVRVRVGGAQAYLDAGQGDLISMPWKAF